MTNSRDYNCTVLPVPSNYWRVLYYVQKRLARQPNDVRRSQHLEQVRRRQFRVEVQQRLGRRSHLDQSCLDQLSRYHRK